MLRVAKQWGQPPLTVLAGRPKKWNTDDTLLALALELYERDRIDAHGAPRRRTENEAFVDAWEIDGTITNYLDKTIEQWRKEQGEIEPGVRPNVVFAPTIRPEDR